MFTGVSTKLSNFGISDLADSLGSTLMTDYLGGAIMFGEFVENLGLPSNEGFL